MGLFNRLTSRTASAVPPREHQQDDLIHELLHERRRDRRAGLFKAGFFAVLGMAYVGWMAFMFAPVSAGGPPAEPFAAVVRVSGMIADGKPASYEKLAPLLRRAFTHPNSKGVILQINSPGGTPVQSALIHDLIIELKTTTKKPVVAVGEDMMTSGAYMIAVAADTLVANRSSLVGSIGVISAGFGFSDLLDRVGVERRVMTAGNSKNMMDPFSPVKPEDQVRQRDMLEHIHSHFKELVVEGRGDRLDLDTAGLFEGAVWTGKQAHEYGLIDELGRVDTAIKKHLKVAKAYEFESRKPLMQSVLGGLGVEVANGLMQVMQPQSPVMASFEP